jgi:hypothetical protein
MIKAFASLLLVVPLTACVVGTAISATGAVVGAAVDVTGSVVGATVKTTGAVIDAAVPGDDEEDENDDD